MNNNIVKFLKSKDYKLMEELGRGACGKTVKLYDEVIDEVFVCKKYEPFNDNLKEELFVYFIQEIKLLYLLNHKNVVRVFSYYIYPEKYTGYILMEYIEGVDIENYLSSNPQNINEMFNQCVSGFLHLEKCKVLHRDIRPLNILVSNDDDLKIIDFGFGKRASTESDFDKSISLNLWCDPPIDFNQEQYSFRTEVYFVGKLFEKIIREQSISTFKYGSILSRMCEPEPGYRISSFLDVSSALSNNKFDEIEFSDSELAIYREFSESLHSAVNKIATNCQYVDDSDMVHKKLEDCYRNIMLEEYAPSSNVIVRCFLNGSYYYSKHRLFSVLEIKEFLELLHSCSKDKKNIIIDNLRTRLDSIERYSEPPQVLEDGFDDDIPF